MVLRCNKVFACYLDESGDTGTLPHRTSPVQPLLCVLGLSLDLNSFHHFSHEFIELKAKFFPGSFPASSTRLGRILKEIKGADIRTAFRASSTDHALRHTAIGFLDSVLNLVESYNCRIFGRVWIKSIGAPMDSWAPYTSSTQAICSTFHHLLSMKNRLGLVILDPRRKAQDRRVSFSIFTKKFNVAGDAYPRIIEVPTFGQGENHAGVQVVDLLVSGLLFPIATYTYCTGYVDNIHVDPGYRMLKERYGVRLRDLQHRYDLSGRWLGGIVTSDPLGYRHGGYLFM